MCNHGIVRVETGNGKINIRKVKENRRKYPQLAELLESEPDELSPESFLEVARILMILVKSKEQTNLGFSEHNNNEGRK